MGKTIMKNASIIKNGYYLEDINCCNCLYYKGKVRGCSLTACSCEDIKQDAISKNRIKRKRGSMKWDM